MVSPGDAAGDLQVDDPVPHPITPHRLAQHGEKRLAAHGRSDRQLAEAALEPNGVTFGVGESPAEDRPHLVDAVGELEAPILHMHARLGVRGVATVDIGDAAHGPLLEKLAATVSAVS